MRIAAMCLLLAGCAHGAQQNVSAPSIDSSRGPLAPDSLDASAVFESYPREAREAAASGVAIVRIILSAEGDVTEVTVLREDPVGYGFGEACANVIRAHDSGWQPAVDESGRPVAHRFSYRCAFELDVRTHSDTAVTEPPRDILESPSEGEPLTGMLVTSASGEATPRTAGGSSLARPPIPPAGLDDAALRRVFPVDARRAGISGSVVVRISLDAEGQLTDVAPVRETPTGYGFADACTRVIRERGGNWQPALDAVGVPTASRFTFACTFEVRVRDPQPPSE